jgi:signal transduction histidine kinase
MRTPLAALLGQIEVALRRNRSPEEYRRVLSAVQTQAGHLRQIMEMLLFLARADAEAKLPGLQTVDLEPWLGEHLQAWSGHPRSADLRLEAEPTTDMASDHRFAVEAQPPPLGQLVDNLLDNACKYSEPGTPISLGLRVEKGDVCLEVKDRGCGIAPEDLPHVFDAFYRSSQARRLGVDGVGLGLAVAQRIAVAFDGTITVQSEPGMGSSFTLRLPEAKAGSHRSLAAKGLQITNDQ